jgi:hypothetical protein
MWDRLAAALLALLFIACLRALRRAASIASRPRRIAGALSEQQWLYFSILHASTLLASSNERQARS